MRKLKIMLSTVFTIAITAICITLINTNNSYANPHPYMTIDYKCKNGRVIDRCDYGHSGCDIAGQELCDIVVD